MLHLRFHLLLRTLSPCCCLNYKLPLKRLCLFLECTACEPDCLFCDVAAIDSAYVALEAARPLSDLPPPKVGEWVESKAAHEDAHIFR